MSFTASLISLSVMLSSSIHAVTNGRSSFFLLRIIPLCKCTIFIFCFFLKKNFIVIQVQLYAFSSHPSTPPQLNPPPSSTSPLGFVHVSSIVVPVIPSSLCPPCPQLLLDCSQLQYLWLYFVCFFLLLIMFQLKVRSYGICTSQSGLFHLA